MRAFSYGRQDGDHTIQSLESENPMLYANLVAVRFIELELRPLDVFH